jgi:hypothetical protein
LLEFSSLSQERGWMWRSSKLSTFNFRPNCIASVKRAFSISSLSANMPPISKKGMETRVFPKRKCFK